MIKLQPFFFSGLMPNEYSVCTFQDELALIHWTNSFFFSLRLFFIVTVDKVLSVLLPMIQWVNQSQESQSPSFFSLGMALKSQDHWLPSMSKEI